MGGVATRVAFGKAIVSAAERDARVVVLTGDLRNSTNTEAFAEKFPQRFFEIGIAETDMIGVAAGLALSGKIPFACSFSAFVAGRLENVRLSIAYNRANVRLVGTHAGIGIGDDGATQMALEDIAAIRALPGVAIIQPADGIETAHVVDYLLEHEGPVFLRLMRQATDDVHDERYRFRFGAADQLRGGGDVALVATGGPVPEALKAAEKLAADGISARVLNIHTIAPIDRETILSAARDTGHVLTAEDHNVNGGLGSAVAEVLAEAGVPARLVRVGLHSFGESGTAEELYERYGLSSSRLADAARALLNSDTPV
jgi:transketolase